MEVRRGSTTSSVCDHGGHRQGSERLVSHRFGLTCTRLGANCFWPDLWGFCQLLNFSATQNSKTLELIKSTPPLEARDLDPRTVHR